MVARTRLIVTLYICFLLLLLLLLLLLTLQPWVGLGLFNNSIPFLYIYIACLIYLNTHFVPRTIAASRLSQDRQCTYRGPGIAGTPCTHAYNCSLELIIKLLSNYRQRCFCCKLKNFEIETDFCFRGTP